MSIGERFQKLRRQVPEDVRIVLACKTRTLDEVREALEAGATDIAYNYVQEGREAFDGLPDIRGRARWHMIGHLQKNKINKAVPVFDMYQTIDCLDTAQALNQRVGKSRDRVDVLLEINSGREAEKSGLFPEYDKVVETVQGILSLPGLCFQGLMTMGPWSENAEDMRPAFAETAAIFRRLQQDGFQARTLSMGMSDSYEIAIQEGATMIRVGTCVFGPRKCRV